MSDAAEQPVDELSFDRALEQLETLAERLEEGDIPLEDALSVYERAVALFSHCRKRLDGVEQRLDRLTRDLDDELTTEPIEPPEESAEDAADG